MDLSRKLFTCPNHQTTMMAQEESVYYSGPSMDLNKQDERGMRNSIKSFLKLGSTNSFQINVSIFGIKIMNLSWHQFTLMT